MLFRSSGTTQEMAKNVVMGMSSEQGIIMNNLKANEVALDAKADTIAFNNYTAGGNMTLTTNKVTVNNSTVHTDLTSADILMSTQGKTVSFIVDDKTYSGPKILHKANDVIIKDAFKDDLALNNLMHEMALNHKSNKNAAHNLTLPGKETEAVVDRNSKDTLGTLEYSSILPIYRGQDEDEAEKITDEE